MSSPAHLQERSWDTLNENQFGPSDHDHFAKVVMYACEASASVVIWIVAGTGGTFRATPLRPEHQRALCKLNNVFVGEIVFYGLAIELKSDPIEQSDVDYPCLPSVAVVVEP